jgi:hypothetical protein
MYGTVTPNLLRNNGVCLDLAGPCEQGIATSNLNLSLSRYYESGDD